MLIELEGKSRHARRKRSREVAITLDIDDINGPKRIRYTLTAFTPSPLILKIQLKRKRPNVEDRSSDLHTPQRRRLEERPPTPDSFSRRWEQAHFM